MRIQGFKDWGREIRLDGGNLFNDIEIEAINIDIIYQFDK